MQGNLQAIPAATTLSHMFCSDLIHGALQLLQYYEPFLSQSRLRTEDATHAVIFVVEMYLELRHAGNAPQVVLDTAPISYFVVLESHFRHSK